jgi:hypothetical protein
MHDEQDEVDVYDEPLETVRDAEQALRGIVDALPRGPLLLADTRRWNMICAALDVIGDTESALAAYLDEPAAGHPYLNAYGVLQALYLQQDAIRHVFEALDVDYAPTPVLKDIRQVRNETIGHPSSVRGKAFVIIVQLTVDQHGFDYNRETADGVLTTHHVDLRALITSQRSEALAILRTLHAQLCQEWQAVMKKHSETKLVGLLPQTWSYHAGNLWRAVESPEGALFGQIHLQMLLEPVIRIEQELCARSEPLESLDWSLPRLRHALERLRDVLAGRLDGFEKRDTEIYIAYATQQLERLQKRLVELDEEYEEAAAQE